MITIELFGIYIQEPMASLTDLVVAWVSFFYFLQLSKLEKKEMFFIYYKYYFLFLGISMVLSGLLGHALLYYIEVGWKLPGWLMSMFAVMAIEQAAIEQAKPYFSNVGFNNLIALNFSVLILLATLAFYYIDFLYIALYSTYGLILIVLSIQCFLYYKTRSRASIHTITAIGITLLSVIVFVKQISPHPWFDHLALSHTILACSVYFYYRGVAEVKLDTLKLVKEVVPS